MPEVSVRPPAGREWLWEGCVAAGAITLLVSPWKVGKTTLATGLLRALGRGEPFLGRAVAAGKALVVSEESTTLWADRLRRIPVGPHVQLLARPFRGRPTFDQWYALLDEAGRRRQAGELDLLVIDPMAVFLPGAWESSPTVLADALGPVRGLTAAGLSALLLHHPRKGRSEAGSSARGPGALLGLVDIVLELGRYGRPGADDRRRQLVSVSPDGGPPARLVYEWGPDGAFTALGDPGRIAFERHWDRLAAVLGRRPGPATHAELLRDWPADQERPSGSLLYEWLAWAYAEKRVRREGRGTKSDPWRYRVASADDEYYARGELPPLKRDLPPLPGVR